jgi:hypothetical protein
MKKVTSKRGKHPGADTGASVASPDTSRRERFRSTLKRARAEKAFSNHADKQFATKPPRVRAAHDEAKVRLSNAWKSDFQQAIALAASHVPLSKPQTSDDRDAIRKLIETLQELLDGRPLGRATQIVPMVELAAAHLVQERLKLLRLKLGKERISKNMAARDKLIADAIKQVSFQFSIPPAKISADNIYRLVFKK